jgi:serine/threonine protein kinase
MIGRAVSHYRLVSHLGSGGMGVVYAAEDLRLGRSVALKFVPEDLAKDPQAVHRLRAEARAASALNHPNICTIHDIGEDEGRPFIVMELMKGRTLRDRLAMGPLKIHEVVDIGIQVADALDAAHSSGIIHRDIKPANLFLTERRQVKILDFGLAKLLPAQASAETTAQTPPDHLTVEGATIGTVSYMSPEQVSGEQLDGRTDLFSLGIVLYECVTGHRPFVGKTPAVIFSGILNRSPVAPIVYNPEVPLRLQDVIVNCLEKDRELRYQDAAGLRADLKRVKRDLESGHSTIRSDAAAESFGGKDASTLAGGGRGPVSRTGPSTAASRDSLSPSTSSPVMTGPRHLIALVAGVALLVAIAALATGLYLKRPGGAVRSPGVATTATATDSVVRPRLEAAATSLQAAKYRAALVDAEEVLRVVPDQAEAIRIRDAARAMVAGFDNAIATADRLLEAGDVGGAAGAVATARTIDPTAPAVAERSARIADRSRNQSDAARRVVEPSRGASPSGSGTVRQQPNEPPRATASPHERAGEPPAASSQLPPPSAPVPVLPAPPAATTPPPAEPPPAPAPSAAPRPAAPEPPARTNEAPPRTDAPAASRERDTNPAPPPQAEDDESAIRRIVATYARAIETKDLALFRSVKPNLSSEEQRRLEGAFRAVTSQRVSITILSVNRRGQEATVRLKRHDEIEIGGRSQTTESQQTLMLVHAGTGWVIRDIGR